MVNFQPQMNGQPCLRQALWPWESRRGEGDDNGSKKEYCNEESGRNRPFLGEFSFESPATMHWIQLKDCVTFLEANLDHML